jgi:hypothetical protein
MMVVMIQCEDLKGQAESAERNCGICLERIESAGVVEKTNHSGKMQRSSPSCLWAWTIFALLGSVFLNGCTSKAGGPAATPVISPSTSSFLPGSTPTVTITDSTPGAVIHYTTGTNGNPAPVATISSPPYTQPITVSTTTAISAIALAEGAYSSAPASATLTILVNPPAPTFSPSPGIYTQPTPVTITTSATGTTIYYTTDGSTPTASSTLYSGPVTVSTTETIKAIVVTPTSGPAGLVYSGSSAVATALYTIHLPGFSMVSSGLQPISGATIQLYQVGATGYQSAAVPLLNPAVIAGTDGSFNVSGKYICKSGTYLYIMASGGAVGGAGTNRNLALGAVAGLCDNLTGNSSFQINEETTVAMAYALARFTGGTTFGTSLLNQAGTSSIAPADNLSTAASNIQGLANAMAIAQVLANSSSGASPGNNSNVSATVDYWQINTIANMLAACDSTAGLGSGGGNCDTLFANVPQTSGAPADTFQAVLALAEYPTVSSTATASLYALIGSGAPYMPYADSGSIADFTIGVTYTPIVPATKAAVLTDPNQVAFDSVGNAWITNQGSGSPVVELDPTGNPVQAGTAGTYKITNYYVGTTATTIGGAGSGLETYGIALDTADNPWVADYFGGVIFKITGSGGIVGGANGGGATGTSPSSTSAIGYNIQADGGPATSRPAAVAVDGLNDIWFTQAGASITLTGSCGAYTDVSNKGIGGFLAGSYGTYFQGGVGNYGGYSMAIDGGGSYDAAGSTAIPDAPFIWVPYMQASSGGYGGAYNGFLGMYYSKGSSEGCTTPLSGIGTASIGQTTKLPQINPSGSDAINVLGSPVGVAIDHSGNVWIANNSFVDANATIKYSVTKLVPNYGAAFTEADQDLTFQNFTIGTGGASNTYGADYLAIDGSGDVWVSGTGGGGVVELSNSGTTLSPVTGYSGSTSGSGAKKRVMTGSKGVAVDLSGNIWLPNATSTSVTVLVGAGIPVVAPLSVAIKNNTLGTRP